MSLCYKAYMRKWMRERLKRRKKAEKSSGPEASQAPLQPAYFEAQEKSEDAESTTPVSSATHDSAESPAAEPTEGKGIDSQPTVPSTGPAPETKRRRRGRGGRGRGRSRDRAAESGAVSSASGGEVASHAAVVPSAPGVPVSAPERPPKGVVVLAIGLPGSGKSSWFKRHNITPLSSDLLRSLLFDDPLEQRFQDLVFSNLRSMLKARLIARRPMNFVDATNLTPHERHNWINLAKDYGYEVQAVFFDVPLDVCLERNRKRQRVVEEDVMRRMSAKLKAPTFEEGFSKITVVRVKKKEHEAAS